MSARDGMVVRILRDALDSEPGEREGIVEARCAGDAVLRARVMSLVRQAQLIEQQDGEVEQRSNPVDESPDRLIGSSLGAFRIVERIGRGGMGVVYRGEREADDVVQTVAIKLIRRGFDFDDVHARFLRERRILARLEHPNIARFIDGGMADDGRPWFALEFVAGIPITDWCDAQRLDVRARVRLFLEVCAAVQYAHAQLVVHRDLKPGNVLVDERGAARLLDFGIARLLGGDDDGDTTMTLAGAGYALTPEYAAPEQFTGTAVGVAVDVYALGVLAYALVSGATPYDIDRGDVGAAQRTVLETPPQALTLAIGRGSDAERIQRLAARATTAPAYRKLVRGDLARILETALAKLAQHRYATVAAFADDLQRWLDGIPVQVSGNRVGYRLAKFLQRNRVAAAFAAIATIAVIAGIVGMAWQVREAHRQRDAAIIEADRGTAVRDYVMLMFRDAAADAEGGRPDIAGALKLGSAQIFTRFAAQPEVGRNVALMLGELFVHLGDPEAAKPLLEGILDSPDVERDPALLAEARYQLADVEFERGEAARAQTLLTHAQAGWIEGPAANAQLLNVSRGLQASLQLSRGDAPQAIATLDAAVRERRVLLPRPDRELATMLTSLVVALLTDGQFQAALTRADEAVAMYQSLGLERSSAGLAALNNRASAAFRLEQYATAIADFRRVADLRRRLHGETTELADSLNNLAFAMMRQGDHAQAIPLLEQALRIAIAKSGERGRSAFAPRRNLADAYVAVGRIADAAPLAESAVTIGREQFGEESVFAGTAYATRARVRVAQHRRAAAQADVEAAARVFTALGSGGVTFLDTLEPLRRMLAAGERTP